MSNTPAPVDAAGNPLMPSSTKLIYTRLSDIPLIATAHATGKKKVLSKGRPDLTRITQVAWGTLEQADEIPAHAHADMDEYFFFTRGSGVIKIDGADFELAPCVYISVPATAIHSLHCTGETLEFFYFGLQVYNSASPVV